MPMHSEGEDTKGRDDHQSTRDDTNSVESDGSSIGGLAEEKRRQQPDLQHSQEGAMPPSQTDDDQYDQGTVKRES